MKWECLECARVCDLGEDDYCPTCGRELPSPYPHCEGTPGREIFLRDNAVSIVEARDLKIKRLKSEVTKLAHARATLRRDNRDLRDAIRLMAGRDDDAPWDAVSEADVDSWLAEIRRLKKLRAKWE